MRLTGVIRSIGEVAQELDGSGDWSDAGTLREAIRILEAVRRRVDSQR